MDEANKESDTWVGTRTRMRLSKLKKVEELPTVESGQLLDNTAEIDEYDNKDNLF